MGRVMKDSTDTRTIDAFSGGRKGRGGARRGAGRPKTAEDSTVVRVPRSKLDAVQAVISGSDVSLAALESVRELAGQWARACAGREDKPRWAKVHELVAQLQAALKISQSGTLERFAFDVRRVAGSVSGLGRWHGLVFISALWESETWGMSFDAFQANLLECSRLGLLRLARADLVAAMPAELVEASETCAGAAVFHFVCLD